MKISKPNFVAVVVVVLIAGPSVLHAFLGEYPWQVKFAVTGVLVLALVVGMWPAIKRKQQDDLTGQSDADSCKNKEMDNNDQ